MQVVVAVISTGVSQEEPLRLQRMLLSTLPSDPHHCDPDVQSQAKSYAARQYRTHEVQSTPTRGSSSKTSSWMYLYAETRTHLVSQLSYHGNAETTQQLASRRRRTNASSDTELYNLRPRIISEREGP